MADSASPLRLQNPFKREHIPEHMQSDQIAHVRWRNTCIAVMAIMGITAGLLTPVIWYTFTSPFRLETWNQIQSFFGLVFQGELLRIHLLFAQSFGPGFFAVIGGTLFAYCLVMFVAILPGGIAALFNPHRNMTDKHGYAEWADERALHKMEDRKQVGIKGGFLMALGRWPVGKLKGQMVQMIETLSCLCLAPPGTGKTAGLVVPTLVTSDDVSFIVNDPKPELWEFTSSYRSQVSHVFMLNWSKTDEPNYVVTFYKKRAEDFWKKMQALIEAKEGVPEELEPALASAESEVVLKIDPARFKVVEKWMEDHGGVEAFSFTEPVFYPRFNFLSPRLVPPPGPDRDTYLDSIAKTLIPDKKGGDSYFQDKGRAALTGFMHLIVAKVGDAGDYVGIPANWNGHEPSIPMLSDWIAISQFNATGSGAQTAISAGDAEQAGAVIYEEPEPAGDGNGDKLGEWIRRISNDIKNNPEYPADHPNNRGKSERAFMELATLINMADKERSGVLGTMDQALIPFKNAAVKERTSACDFTPDDMRGIFDPAIAARTVKDHEQYLDPKSEEYQKLYNDRANWKPVTLYICVNQAEAQAFANITALLYQVLSRDLLSFGPKEFNEKTKRQLGPSAVCFCLDEFAKLPKIDAVIEGPDLGRSKKTSYMLVAQDYGQIEKAYTKEDVEIINSTTAIKHILPQNNPQTVERIQKMVGQTTIKDRNKSGTEGLSKQANPLAANVSEQTSGVNFLRTEDVAALQPGKNIIIVQGFANRPMKLDTPMYYYPDSGIADRVFPGRSRLGPDGKHARMPGPHLYLPPHILGDRKAKHAELVRRRKNTDIQEDAERPKITAKINGMVVDISPTSTS